MWNKLRKISRRNFFSCLFGGKKGKEKKDYFFPFRSLATKAKGFTPLNPAKQGFRFQRNHLTGFTLIEIMTAIFVFLVALIGVSLLLSKIFFFSGFASSKLIAAYLCQEGIEVVRSIRDSNWIVGNVWDQGLDAGQWEIDYNDTALSPWQDRFLRLDSGFYNYAAVAQTKFKRRIEIGRPDSDKIQLGVIVTWSERGRNYEVSVYEELYNWNQ